MKLPTTLFLILIFKFSRGQLNNVCTNLPNYLNRDFSDKCYYNPDVGLSIEETIRAHGFTFQVYNLTTEDGYELKIFNIPGTGRPVLLNHGLFCSGQGFLLHGNESMAFVLSRNGYDVWLANFRGTYHSNGHTNKRISNKDYWDFSFHEMAIYDLPVMLDLINQKTSQKIIVVGHSMGATTNYVYAITHSEDAKNKISALVSMSSIAYYTHVTHFSHWFYPLFYKLKPVFDLFHLYSFGMSNDLRQRFYKTVCLRTPGTRLICEIVMVIFLENLLPPESIPALLTMVPAGTSFKSVYHYAQESLAGGQFQYYDYKSGNQAKYNSSTPPIYDVTKIDVPVHLFYGDRDDIGDKKDVFNFYDNLKTEKSITKICENGSPDFSHIDFLVGRGMECLYEPLLYLLKSIN